MSLSVERCLLDAIQITSQVLKRKVKQEVVARMASLAQQGHVFASARKSNARELNVVAAFQSGYLSLTLSLSLSLSLFGLLVSIRAYNRESCR
jgi:hypothetical protein